MVCIERVWKIFNVDTDMRYSTNCDYLPVGELLDLNHEGGLDALDFLAMSVPNLFF